MASGLGPNALVLRIQPDEGITLRFGAKVPGQAFQVRTVTMDFSYGAAFLEETPDAYERLLLDAMVGDPTLFIRTDEAKQAWTIWEPSLRRARPLARYAAGSWGPAEADALLGRGAVVAEPVAPTLLSVWSEDGVQPRRRAGRPGATCGGPSRCRRPARRVLTLVIVATRRGVGRSRAQAAVHELGGRHPARVLTLVLDPLRVVGAGRHRRRGPPARRIRRGQGAVVRGRRARRARARRPATSTR